MIGALTPSEHKAPAAQVVHIVEDDDLFRASLVDLLESHNFIIAAFEDAEAFFSNSSRDIAGCVLADVHLPKTDGIEFRRQLLAQGFDIPVIFMTAHGNVATSVSAMKTGALDFLQKPLSSKNLMGAIAEAFSIDVNRQERRALRHLVQERTARLTPRESQVLHLVVTGLMNKQIAFELGISEIMAKLHRGSMMKKMQVGSLAELVKYYTLLTEEIA
ncbi:MAG: response regulator [Pseudorhizobium pelagicum]|uniref:response regulator transcription factor n=1 Tax=Pseudorhizobium pelagicum TaxID=1509405 RepID=UPI0034607EED